MSWIIGIASWGFVQIIMEIALKELKIPIGDISDEDVEGVPGFVGGAIMFLSFMIAFRVGMAIYTGNINGGVSRAGNIMFKAWFFGILNFGIGGVILLIVLKNFQSDFMHMFSVLLMPVLAGLIFYIGKNWTEEKIANLEKVGSDSIKH